MRQVLVGLGYAVALLLILATLFLFIPALISAKSTLAVTAGILLVMALVCFGIVLVYSAVKSIQQGNS